MKSRLFKKVVCLTLIISLVLGEASVAFATDTVTTVEDQVTESSAVVTDVVLKDYSFKNGDKYTYAGSEIKPEIDSVVVDITYEKEDSTSETTTKTITSFSGVTYKNNAAIGTGHAVIEIEGKTIELPFTIVFGNVTSVKAVSTSNTAIKVTWTKVPGAAGYVLYRSVGSSNSFKALKTITSGVTTSYTNSKLSLGKTYYYKIRPYREQNGQREYGEFSKAIAHKAGPVVPVISSVKRSSYTSLKVSWKKVSGVSGYRIYRSTSPNSGYKKIKTIRGNKKLSYTDKKRSCGKTYYYKIKSFKTKSGKRYYSYASAYVAGKTSPDKTKFNSKTMSWFSSATLSWNKSKGASGYEIYRSEAAKTGYVCVKTINSAKTTKWTNKGLDSGKKYYYKIRAFKTVGSQKVYGAFSSVYTKYLISAKLATLISKYEGKPYRFGGNTPKGWDCSGFVQWATYYLKGKKIPRTAGAQAKGGKYVNKNNRSSWQPGDVLVYKRNGGGVSHVGLYIGGGKIMHALNSRYDTIIQDVDYYERWDGGNYLAAVRRY